MGKKEFFFSVLASIVAAFILEVSGAVEILSYINVLLTMPVWGVICIVLTPILISIYWFRSTKTPEHEKAIKDLKELEEKYNLLDSSLTESKLHTSAIETMFNESQQNKASIESELQHWKENGVMLLDNVEMEKVVDKIFGAEIVEIDGKHFIGCQFNGSIMKFRGVGPVGFSHDTFNDVRWVMDSPAANAITILKAMYQSGMPEMIDLVEKTFENIRGDEFRK
ncbi:hypothetical protein [Aeromonas sp. 602293]|uniref:hypothetical protein n=1 Tax=Aeromonas sp. 602293 TaxID=2712041 RepID=UPI003BA0382D